jgi:GTP pyrophosphokinase
VQSSAGGDIGAELRQLFRDERIFVSTPRGHVLDLAAGSTPVDFAYRVHTEIGHRCRGALVQGRRVPLNARLANGQRVEILTGPEPVPQRSWLDLHLGFATSGRAREKIRDWFRSRPASVNEREGRARVQDLLDRLGFAAPAEADWQLAASDLEQCDAAAMCRAVATGDCQTLDALEALHGASTLANQLDLLSGARASAIGEGTYRVAVLATDRQELLRDVTQVLSELRLSLLGNSGHVDPTTEQAQLTLDIRVSGLRELATVVDRLGHLDGVVDARVAHR